MKPVLARAVITLVVALPLACAAPSGSMPLAAEVGRAHQISKHYETVQRSSDGSSGSSRGRDVLLERVIAATDSGLELEFDLSDQATPEDRARSWQFPVRILAPESGPMQVQNWPELDARLDAWLAAAGLTRAHCGQWIFTWNAFRIDCDAASVIATVESFSLGHAPLHEGDAYGVKGARAPGTLKRSSVGPEGSKLSVLLDIDPDAVRRARAESDVAVGEMMGQPVSLESALAGRSGETVSGTITVTIDTDAEGMPWRRTSVTEIEIKAADGETESQTTTETLERKAVPGPGQ